MGDGVWYDSDKINTADVDDDQSPTSSLLLVSFEGCKQSDFVTCENNPDNVVSATDHTSFIFLVDGQTRGYPKRYSPAL